MQISNAAKKFNILTNLCVCVSVLHNYFINGLNKIISKSIIQFNF